MRILITGAGGLVGRALTAHFGSRHDLFPFLHGDLDITDAKEVRDTIAARRPDLIVNCAVLDVDACERDRASARRLNVDGPALLARAASSSGASLMHFSTNYVFSGTRSDGGFYLPEDVALPINFYGEMKLLGEQLVQAECPRSWIIRTSWVFGQGKESFLATVSKKLREGERVEAISDIFASATYVADLAERVETIVTSADHGLYHVNNSGVCSYAEFANEAGEILGLPESQRTLLIEQRSAESMKRLAPRPRWTPMRCTHSERAGLPELRSWQKALAAYIATETAPPSPPGQEAAR